MHPLIAFLSFIFSPTEDWFLKQTFELVLDPSRLPAVVEAYERFQDQYPSIGQDSTGQPVSMDGLAFGMWAQVLKAHGDADEAKRLWQRLLKDPLTSSDLADDIRVRLGEMMLAQGRLDQAQDYFLKVVDHPNPRFFDAHINLVLCDLAQGRQEKALARSLELAKLAGPSLARPRAFFAMGLATFANGSYEEAIQHFFQTAGDPRADYFSALAHRHLFKPREALALWDKLRGGHPDSLWSEWANFQMAETYFSLGDDRLCRSICEEALERTAPSPIQDNFSFRLASLDMKSGDYKAAIARLTNLLENRDLKDRALTLMAESFSKTGDSKGLFHLLARSKHEGDSALSLYQAAWAASFDQQHERALAITEKGLEGFFDPNVTPRLLLLQALAYEHLGKEAEALALYQIVADRFPNTEAAAQAAHWTLLAYMRMGRWREAVTHGAHLWARLGEDLQRRHPESVFWLGEAHLKLERYEDADRFLQTFLAMAPLHNELVPYAQFERSLTLARLNQPTEALALLEPFAKTAHAQGNQDWVRLASLQRGHIHFNQNHYENAIVAYRAVEGSGKALYYQGLALYRLEYYSDAIQTWMQAAVSHKSSEFGEMAAFRLARAQFELGRATEAVASFARYRETYPNGAHVKESLLQSAHALYNAADYGSAAPLYATYLSRYNERDDRVSVAPYLASCYVRLGKSPEDIKTLLKGLPPTETLASLQWEKGAESYNQKKYSEAETLFSDLLASVPTHDQSSSALFYQGESLFVREQWTDAQGAYQNYLTLYPDPPLERAPLALFHQAASLYRQGQLLKAAHVFQAFVEKYPDEDITHQAKENLALCYYNLGHFDKAREMIQRYGGPDLFNEDKGSPDVALVDQNSSPSNATEETQRGKDQTHRRVFEKERKNAPSLSQRQAPVASNPSRSAWGHE